MLFKELIKKLESEATSHHSFSQTLWKQGDKVNSQYQEGYGDGIVFAINLLNKIQKDHLNNVRKLIK